MAGISTLCIIFRDSLARKPSCLRVGVCLHMGMSCSHQIGAKVAPGARTAGAALRLTHLLAVPANVQGLEQLQHMYLVNNAILDLVSWLVL